MATLMSLGATVQLTATVLDDNGQSVEGAVVTWQSGDEAVATVIAEGLVMAVRNGTARITATSGSATVGIDVTVMQSAGSIVIAPEMATLMSLGATVQLTATVLDDNGQSVEGAVVTWQSGDEAVATVSAQGLVTAVMNGTARVMATSGAATSGIDVTVVQSAGSIVIAPDEATLMSLGATVQLTATVLDDNGQSVEGAVVTWQSGDEAVATVSAEGLVMAVRNGTARITATSGSATVGIDVTVMQSAGSIVIAPEMATLMSLGETVQLTATVLDDNGQSVEGAVVTWQSGDEAVATVSAQGLVTAVMNGTARVMATSGAATSGIDVTVVQSAGSIVIAPDEATLMSLGATVQLTATVLDDNGQSVEGAVVTWQSGDEAVATVSAEGLVMAVRNGTARITATSGSATVGIDVTVMQSAGSIVIAPEMATLMSLGETVQLTATVLDDNGQSVEGAVVTWQSGDDAVATVSAEGLVMAVRNGTARITATSGSATVGIDVTVMQSAGSIVIAPEMATLMSLGATVQLTAMVLDHNGQPVADATVTWQSSDEAIATVSTQGLVTAVANGTATIKTMASWESSTATAGEASGEAVVTVMQSAGSVVVSPSTSTVALGDTLRLVAEAFDENGHQVESAQFDWSSTDVSVVWVDGSGLITALALGTATITASVGDARGTADITVENPDRAALVALYEAMDGPNWRNSENWLTDEPLENWYGVRPDAFGRVARLALFENNLIGSIPPELGHLSRLTELVLWGNRIEDISSLAVLTNLTVLSLAQNNITDISALSGLTNLKELRVGDANIQDISPLAGLINLVRLSVLAVNLRDEDLSLLSGLTNLKTLGLSHNSITDISALSELTGLTRLWLWDNQIEDISSLASLTNLTFLSCGKNNITDISALTGLTNLTEMFLNENNITDLLPFSGLTNLTYLNLSANSIEDISPLSSLTNLRKLNLSANNIEDISPLSGLTDLEDLDLRGNPYENFPDGDFDIELVLLDEFTESQKNVLQYIARRWMAVVTEDLPDYEFTEGWSDQCGSNQFEIPPGDRIDDLRIYVTKERLNVLGFGGPIVLREATHLPVLGCIGLDLSHANLLITGLHEVGHVLGVGSLWDELGYFQNPLDGDQHFNGPLAIAAFDAAGGWDYAGARVPVEGGHWRGSVFGDELMTPTGTGAISTITAQSLVDLGYVVDITQADPYVLPAARTSSMQAVVIEDDKSSGQLASPAQENPMCDLNGEREAIYVVDQKGRVILTIGN